MFKALVQSLSPRQMGGVGKEEDRDEGREGKEREGRRGKGKRKEGEKEKEVTDEGFTGY